MSAGYRAVQWSRQIRRYDAVLGLGLAAYVAAFLLVGFMGFAQADETTLLIRAFGTAAFVLLHLLLAIGPLSRLSPRYLPLLYNRRHMGVTLFFLALAHAALATLQYHAQSDLNPLVSVLVSDGRYDSFGRFPFQPLGALALLILLLMAATSHDFWLAALTPRTWKALHMGVYLVYALLVLHVALGVLQLETSPVYALLLGTGVAVILGLHLLAGFRERALDREATPDAEHWVDAGDAASIPDRRARIVSVAGERVAVFRDGAQLFAIANVCRHQHGPLGEGCIRDGLVTCPWHGYQYRPQDGTSPPPFTEKVETYALRIVDSRVQVCAQASPPGTPQTPAMLVGSQ